MERFLRLWLMCSRLQNLPVSKYTYPNSHIARLSSCRCFFVLLTPRLLRNHVFSQSALSSLSAYLNGFIVPGDFPPVLMINFVDSSLCPCLRSTAVLFSSVNRRRSTWRPFLSLATSCGTSCPLREATLACFRAKSLGLPATRACSSGARINIF